MNILESLYLWQLDTGFLPSSYPENVKVKFRTWLKLAPAYSLFMGATLWFLPIFGATLVYLIAQPGLARNLVTLFFWDFSHYVRYFTLPAVVLGFLLFLPQLWVWNRRVDHLNREASLRQPALATDISIWPPPPIASLSADALPKK